MCRTPPEGVHPAQQKKERANEEEAADAAAGLTAPPQPPPAYREREEASAVGVASPSHLPPPHPSPPPQLLHAQQEEGGEGRGAGWGEVADAAAGLTPPPQPPPTSSSSGSEEREEEAWRHLRQLCHPPPTSPESPHHFTLPPTAAGAAGRERRQAGAGSRTEGHAGLQGARGAQGSRAAGHAGRTGLQGSRARGAHRAAGQQGVRGAQGCRARGARRTAGRAWRAGLQGAQGAQGSRTEGHAGRAGLQGVRGAQGSRAAGHAGHTGLQGSRARGAHRAAGRAGSAGQQGAPGVPAGTGAATGGTGAVPVGTRGPARPRPYFVPLLEQILGLPPSLGPAPPLECPQPVQSQSPLQPVSPLPAPSPYAGPTGGLAERLPGTHQMTLRPSTAPLRVPLPSPPASSLPVLADPASDSLRATSPIVARLLSTVVTDPSFQSTAASALVAELVDFAAHCRLDYAASLVAESASCFAAALPHLVSTLIAPEGDPDEPNIPTPRSYAEAIEGPYSSQWQSAMDVEMASWKSTGTYVDEVPPPGANIVSGMWIFRVKRPPGSSPVFKARYVARGFSQRQGVDYFQTFSPTPKMTTLRVLLHVASQRNYELHSLDFRTAFLQGSLHVEIWLRHPPGFTGSFPPGTQWSLRRPVYGLCQAPREWHDTLRTTLAALGFAPSTADPSLFLRTDTSLPPFYILVYVDDLVFATADTAGLAHVKSELQKRHTCTDLGELRSYLGLRITRDRAQRTITLTQSHMVQQVLQRFDFTYSSPQATPLSTCHSLSALPSDESIEPSGPYPELVGCLMYLMTCTRPDLAYPLSILARYVAPGRHRPEHMTAANRVLRYLCSTSGLGLVLGGRCPVVLTGHADASWADDQATQRSSQGYTFSLGSGSVSWRSTRSSSVLGSSCEAEIYAGAMAAQELRWLTYLLSDLGEPPRSPPVLYVDNKAMLALCREHRLEHRTKHIALRYFLARELQQRGQLRLAYVASEANTADIFTKALPPGDHQRFCTMLACFALLDWSCFLCVPTCFLVQSFLILSHTLRVLLHVAAQRDYELHSFDFSNAFLQGSLHEEIWLRRPSGFTGSFPPGTQWSLRRPVYGLRQAPREWHYTLRTTLAALGFAPPTADPSLFLRTDTLLPPFYILVYVDDLVFAAADTARLTHVKSELQKRHTCTDLGELRSYLGLHITRDRARRTITLTQSHMVQQVLQRFDFTYSSPQATPLSTRHSLSALTLDESVEPSGPYPELVGCLILGSGSVSWRSTRSSSVLSSSCEAEIYAGAMAAQELRWLTYFLTDLGEPPRSPPVLYIDNKAMLALCREHRLEHRTKHIALRYFLARELQ
ncbi:unnamed protein product [Closterium sp. NIES-53]